MMLQRDVLFAYVCLCVPAQSAQCVCMADVAPWGLYKQTFDTELIAGAFEVTGYLNLMWSLQQKRDDIP